MPFSKQINVAAIVILLAAVCSIFILAVISSLKKMSGKDSFADSKAVQSLNYKTAKGENEKCLICHSDIKGNEESHNPLVIGCSGCHLGNPNSLNKDEAHLGMVLIPGNSSNAQRTCGQPNCHGQMIPRMENNIMNSMNGVVSVDKWVLDEAATSTFKQPIQTIGFSLADKHLRNLCASCHLSNEKIEYGPIQELSRGGGCLACHLNYSADAFEELQEALPLHEGQSSNVNKNVKNRFAKYKFIPSTHPQINLDISNMHCFGCHSRSGRISLSYEGWHETLLRDEDVKNSKGFRKLDDGRIVQKIKADIHHQKGMKCVDCHTSYELMGDGNYALHKEDQVKIQCTDCHLKSKPNTKKISEFDFESKKIAELLNLSHSNKDYLTSAKNGFPIVNAFYINGEAFLINKSSGNKARIKSPSFICSEGSSHSSLSCNACHNSWTPQCIGCHSEYDPNSTMYDLLDNKEASGEWLEYPKGMLPQPSTLGVKEIIQNDGTIKKIVDEVMPGMILTINGNKTKNKPHTFKRLFAPAFSHTIQKEGRSCKSCHNNPLALGYGRGKLEYKYLATAGRWQFTPQYPILKTDGLPEDAWTGFLQQRNKNSATREYIRTFTVDEQKKILTVGACLTCHSSNSAVINAALKNLSKTLQLKSNKCILPEWK